MGKIRDGKWNAENGKLMEMEKKTKKSNKSKIRFGVRKTKPNYI